MPAVALVLLVAAQASLKTYDLEGISVALPAVPNRVRPEGAPESVRNWISVAGDEGVGVSLQPADDRKPGDISLAEGLESFVRQYGGRIVAQSDIVLNGWPGLDATLNDPKLGTIRYVSYRTGKGLVTVSASGTGPEGAAFAKRVGDSLALADGFGKGIQKTPGPEWARTVLNPSAVSVEFPRAPEFNTLRAAANSPIQPRVWFMQYGNRRYMAMRMTSLKKNETLATPEGRWKAIQTFNTNTLTQGAHAKLTSRKESTLLGERSERIEGERPDSTVTLIEYTVKGDASYAAIVTVPAALRNSPEVARFFASFRVEPK